MLQANGSNSASVACKVRAKGVGKLFSDMVTFTLEPAEMTGGVLTLTIVLAREALFPLSGSVVVEETLAVLLMVEPRGAPGSTCTVMLMTAEAPAGSVLMASLTLLAVWERVKPGPLDWLCET